MEVIGYATLTAIFVLTSVWIVRLIYQIYLAYKKDKRHEHKFNQLYYAGSAAWAIKPTHPAYTGPNKSAPSSPVKQARKLYA